MFSDAAQEASNDDALCVGIYLSDDLDLIPCTRPNRTLLHLVDEAGHSLWPFDAQHAMATILGAVDVRFD
jgi:hypothetical protein